MAAETSVTLTLPAELVAWLEACVARGEFPSVDAAIAATLAERQARRAEERVAQEGLHRLLDEAEEGPWFDGDDVFRELAEECEADLRPTSP